MFRTGQAQPIQSQSSGTPYGQRVEYRASGGSAGLQNAMARGFTQAGPTRPDGTTAVQPARLPPPPEPSPQTRYAQRSSSEVEELNKLELQNRARRWFIDNRGKFPDVYRATLPALGQPYDQVQHYQAMQAAIRPMRAAYDRELAAYRKSLAPWMPAQVRPGGNAPYRPPPRTPSGELIPAPQMPDSLKNSPFSPFYQR